MAVQSEKSSKPQQTIPDKALLIVSAGLAFYCPAGADISETANHYISILQLSSPAPQLPQSQLPETSPSLLR